MDFLDGPSPGSPTPIASARTLTKVYGKEPNQVRALDGLDIDIPAGRFTAIMGPSGSGKSTLMQCLAGLDRPSSGTITIGDEDITSMSEGALTRLRRRRIGFVFQAFNLLPMLSARQNIVLGEKLAGRRIDAQWLETLTEILGLSERLDHLPSELSGGQQQRVAIARALLARPDIVFADEPTGNLDSESSTQVLDLLRRAVREFDQTIVMVTHDIPSASYADRVVFVADGRVRSIHENPSLADIQQLVVA